MLAVAALIACWMGCASATQSAAVEVAHGPAMGFDLVSNGGFEHDWYNTRGEVMSCPVHARVTFGQADSIPDGWKLDGCGRVADARSGHYAMRIPAGTGLSQSVGYAVQAKAPLEAVPLRVSAWVKGDADARLSVEVSLPALGVKESQEFPCAAQWARVVLDVSADRIADALEARQDPAGAVDALLALRGIGGGVTVDDVAVERPYLASSYSLLDNPGFETVGPDGAPAGWQPVRKSLRHVGSWYYVWRSWYHFMGLPRGENALDELVRAAGERSFRMNVAPGDQKYLEGDPVVLNQQAPRRMAIRFDYNSYMLAGMLVRLMDQDGGEVFSDYLEPGTTGGWHTYQAAFVPRPISPRATPGGAGTAQAAGDAVPLASCALRIGVRGVNGSGHDDINQWVNVNHGGVLWIDNVALMEVDGTPEELQARGAQVHEVPGQVPELLVESIDLGERLYGENVATVTLLNLGGEAAAATVRLNVSGPFREEDPQKAGYGVGAPEQQPHGEGSVAEQEVSARFEAGPGERVTVTLPYAIGFLLPDWRSEYRADVRLDDAAPTRLTFGTWSQQALVEVERCYAFPENTPQPVFLNIGVARRTLDRVEALRLDVRRARDDASVIVKEMPEFQTLAAGFNLSPLPQGFQGDSTNFLLTEVDIAALHVHPQTRPVRDHYVYAAGLGADGEVVFEGRSVRFGRMQVHTEKLAPITDVKIHEDNYLVVNGAPFFTRGHIWMQQNFGPWPLARRNTEWKTYGFNVKAGVQSPFGESESNRFGIGMDEVWQKHHTYVGSQMIATKVPLGDELKAQLRHWASRPYLIGIHFVPWEGTPAGGSQEELVQYARDAKAVIGTRPLWISAGWYAPRVSGGMDPCVLDHDWFMPESNSYFQPSQLDKEVLPKKQARGEPCVLGTYPNVFNDMPWNVERFEKWTEIIRHHTGYMQIGKPGDPTLMAGMNGELRFIESFLFSKEAAPQVAASPNVEHMARARDGRLYILASNTGPLIGGDWEWSTEIRDQGRASHTGSALWSRMHDYMKDYYDHFYKDDRPVTVRKGDRIVQYVFIPEGARAQNLILMARGNGDWEHHAVWGEFDHEEFTDSGVRLWLAKDMHQMSWGTIDIGFCGPEGHDPHHPSLLKHTFTREQFHRMGDLPKAGTWARLEAPVEALGLEGKVVDGFGFVSKGAKVWWERTLLVREGEETVLCDGSVGIPPSQLARVRFNVEGLPAGTRVKVVFDEREIVAGDGYFEDDLSGEPGYENIWVGLYGDKIGETGYYGDGVFYNYNWGRVAARLYEMELP